MPGGTALLNWRFQPLEARTYTVALPIHFGDGSIREVTVSGRGYHPAHERCLATSDELVRQVHHPYGAS